MNDSKNVFISNAAPSMMTNSSTIDQQSTLTLALREATMRCRTSNICIVLMRRSMRMSRTKRNNLKSIMFIGSTFSPTKLIIQDAMMAMSNQFHPDLTKLARRPMTFTITSNVNALPKNISKAKKAVSAPGQIERDGVVEPGKPAR